MTAGAVAARLLHQPLIGLAADPGARPARRNRALESVFGESDVGLIDRSSTLVARPEGLFKPTVFTWFEDAVPDVDEGQGLVGQTCLSLDPTGRGWANAGTRAN